MRTIALVAATTLLFGASCADQSRLPTEPTPASPSFEIRDQAHNGGTEGFFFLPPVVSMPAFDGTFDADLSPIVTICAWENDACATEIALFRLDDGPGGETVGVSTADEHYKVNWHTNEFELSADVTYRILVSESGVALGHADVDVVNSGKELKNVDTDEGELTAAHRLLDKLHATYGTFIDAFVFDGLYPNGPLLTKLTKLKHGALIVLRNRNNEPLKEALALWKDQPPCKVVDDPQTAEHIEFWDADELETLDTYKGKIRVIRAEVTKPGPRPTTSTWCAASIGERPRKLSVETTLKADKVGKVLVRVGEKTWTRQFKPGESWTLRP